MSRMIRLPGVRAIARSTQRLLSRASPARFSSLQSTSVSKRLSVLVLAACRSEARRLMTARIAGSWARRSASLVSS